MFASIPLGTAYRRGVACLVTFIICLALVAPSQAKTTAPAQRQLAKSASVAKATKRTQVESIAVGLAKNNKKGYYITKAAASSSTASIRYVAASGNGTKWHTDASCSKMAGTIAATLAEVQAAQKKINNKWKSFDACKKCA